MLYILNRRAMGRGVYHVRVARTRDMRDSPRYAQDNNDTVVVKKASCV